MDAYRIGITIAMTSNAPAILRGIQRDVSELGKSVERLTGSLAAAKSAMIGLKAGIVGNAALGATAALADAGKDLVHQQALLQEQLRHTPAMSPAKLINETAGATAQAWKTANDVVTSNVAENLNSLRELVQIFGDVAQAQRNLTTVAKAQSVVSSVQGPGADGQVFDMLEAMKLKGVSPGSQHFSVLLDQMVRAAVASGGKVLGSDFLSTFQLGGTATQGWSDQFVGTILPTLIQELRASGAPGAVTGPGHGLMATFSEIVGGGMSNRAAEEFQRLHMVRSNALIRTSTGAVKGVRPGGIVGAVEFQSNPYQWVQDFLLPALHAAGVTNPNKVREEIAHLFSDQTAQQIVTMFASQQQQFKANATQISAASGIGAYGNLVRHDPATEIKAFQEAWRNLMTALGAPLVTTATNLMMSLTHAMNGFTQWAAAHPELVAPIEKTVAVLAALATAVGAFAIGAAAATALGFLAGPAGLLGLAAGIEALGKAFPALPRWLVDMLAGAAAGAAAGSVVPGVGTVAGAAAGAGVGLAAGTLPEGNQPFFVTDGIGGGIWVGDPTIPPPANTHAAAAGPMHVYVVYVLDIAHGTTAHQASQLALPPSGPSGGDPRMNLPMPAFGTPAFIGP